MRARARESERVVVACGCVRASVVRGGSSARLSRSTKLLRASGVTTVSLVDDIVAPTAESVRRNLSAIINFAKFREERLSIFTEHTAKRDSLLAAKKRAADELDGIRRQLAAEQVRAVGGGWWRRRRSMTGDGGV